MNGLYLLVKTGLYMGENKIDLFQKFVPCSDKINKHIPSKIFSCTFKVCWPSKVASNIISENQPNNVIIKVIKLKII